MSLAIVYSRASQGVQAPLVTVEVHLSNGLPGIAIVGLPATAVKESRDRVRSAIMNSRFDIPTKRITVNLAPADLPKEGAAYDLAIAIGILAASNQIPCDPIAEYEFLGELALTGELRPIRAALPAALATHKNQRKLIVPAQNTDLNCLSSKYKILTANSLLDVTGHFIGADNLPPIKKALPTKPLQHPLDLADVKGQIEAKRALEIAASGGHSLLFIGPPGTGKSMLSTRLPTILPKLTEEQALSVAAIHSVSKRGFNFADWQTRPYRSPHHTASAISLVGGGRPPQPGEVSLAHQGILFLDELPEFGRNVLEVLREPLESGTVTITRAACQVEFPAEFQLICAMNPCPCGYAGDSSNRCQCTPEIVQRYQTRISGPLLDRIDMQTLVSPLPKKYLMQQDEKIESSAEVLQRVEKAHSRQLNRQGKLNARLTQGELYQHAKLSDANNNYMLNTMERLQLSARAFYRLLKLARTIADLNQSDNIDRIHLQEAFSFRKQFKRR